MLLKRLAKRFDRQISIEHALGNHGGTFEKAETLYHTNSFPIV